MTWKEAVMKVIEEAKGPLHYHDVTRIILDNEMVLTRGATPHGTVNVVLNDLYRNGEEVGGRRIVKPNPGEFELVPWDGSLTDEDVSATGEWSERGLVRSLEAVLIEVLLPPLNDKRELGLTPFGQAPSG